ncbi:MAG: transposase, partial [Candidatus Poribacteria bacterium]|nr:transposase [Candidatus Poribacteria bacterium]
KVTTGNVNDRTPVKNLCQGLTGKLLADQGYLGKQLLEQLFEDGLELITNLRSNMKNKLIPLGDKLLLGKRLIIETINDQLKNICHIEHSRQRSPVNFRVNLIAGLISDTWKEKKPCIRMPHNALTAW